MELNKNIFHRSVWVPFHTHINIDSLWSLLLQQFGVVDLPWKWFTPCRVINSQYKLFSVDISKLKEKCDGLSKELSDLQVQQAGFQSSQTVTQVNLFAYYAVTVDFLVRLALMYHGIAQQICGTFGSNFLSYTKGTGKLIPIIRRTNFEILVAFQNRLHREKAAKITKLLYPCLFPFIRLCIEFFISIIQLLWLIYKPWNLICLVYRLRLTYPCNWENVCVMYPSIPLVTTLNQSWQAQLARKETECMQLIEERNTLDSEKLAYMRQISRLQMEKVGIGNIVFN